MDIITSEEKKTNTTATATEASSSEPEQKKKHSLLIDVLIHIIALLIVAVVALSVYVKGAPFERGFFCDDQTISYPYLPDTVPDWLLILCCILIPILVITLTELLASFLTRSMEACTLRRTVMNILYWTYRLCYSLFLTLLFTTSFKIIVGRLRPDFLSVCKPEYSNIDCRHFVTNFTCLQTNEDAIKYIRTSFPSGHSSLSVCSAVFTSIFLSIRARYRPAEFLLPLLQTAALMLASFTAFSRIRDNKHHWEDILCGTIIGASMAVSMFSPYLPGIINGTLPGPTAQVQVCPPCAAVSKVPDNTAIEMKAMDGKKNTANTEPVVAVAMN